MPERLRCGRSMNDVKKYECRFEKWGGTVPGSWFIPRQRRIGRHDSSRSSCPPQPLQPRPGFIQDFTSGGVSKNQGSLSLPSLPFPSLPSPPLPSLPLEVGPLKSARGSGETPAEFEFGAFSLKIWHLVATIYFMIFHIRGCQLESRGLHPLGRSA